MSKGILIVGATGNIGSALVSELHKRESTVFAGVRLNSKSRGREFADVPSIAFDFEKPETMKEAFSKVDRAFLLLPLVERMVEYGKAAVDAAKEAGLSFLLKSSELGADPHSPKLALQAQGSVDQHLQGSGIAWSILRPNFFMQNFAVSYAVGIRERGGISLPQGSAKISFIDVRDIAAVAAEILLAPTAHIGRAYDLTGPLALSNHEVAQHLSDAADRLVEYHAASDDDAIKAMSQRGVPQWIIEFVMSLHLHVREGKMADVSSAVLDITRREPIEFVHFARAYASTWKAADADIMRKSV
ncbi:MAG: SDR family oxidoreductase [Burkholderiaceae bacterium]